jgi:mRNA interferase HigB
VRIISRRRIVEFWNLNPDAEQPLRAWYAETRKANWRSPAEIKAVFRSVSILSDNRVVFNVKGNTYRLVVIVEYSQRMIRKLNAGLGIPVEVLIQRPKS